MLPKRRRLTAAEVREVIARGRGRRGTALSVKILETNTPLRCAVVVSKKVARGAVERNRLRRAVYRALESVPLPKTGRAVLFVQATPPREPVPAFAADIRKILHV